MASSHWNSNRHLGSILLRTASIAQAVIVLPIFVFLGLSAFFGFFSPWSVYDFVSEFTTAIMAGAIIAIAYVQRKLDNPTKSQMLQFEIGKAVLATALWVWLMVDSIFEPSGRYRYEPNRILRIKCSAIAVVLLFLLFYPTVAVVYWDVHSGRELVGAEEDNEREPLLAS